MIIKKHLRSRQIRILKSSKIKKFNMPRRLRSLITNTKPPSKSFPIKITKKK